MSTDETTDPCRFCGADLMPAATHCRACGRRQVSFDERHRVLVFLIVMAVVGSAFGTLFLVLNAKAERSADKRACEQQRAMDGDFDPSGGTGPRPTPVDCDKQ